MYTILLLIKATGTGTLKFTGSVNGGLDQVMVVFDHLLFEKKRFMYVWGSGGRGGGGG